MIISVLVLRNYLALCYLNIDDCRTLLFDHPMVGRSLLNHTIMSHVTHSRDDCDLKCYLEDDCMSINFGPGTDGKYYCELSDSDHILHPEDLQNREGFIYRPVEVRLL